MPRSLTLGNGNILVCLDKYAQVRDLYFPYVGLENHVGGHDVHRIGVWVDGKLRWLNHPSWEVSVNCDKGALVSNIKARNNELQLDLSFTDAVYNEKDIFLRKVTIYNKSDKTKDIKLYFSHEFEIYESHRGDTSYFDPFSQSIIHYNGRRVFLINGKHGDSNGFDDYTTGIFNIEGKEGSYKDAEDGMLSQNPIEHGPTDSVVGFYFELEPGKEEQIYYWVTISETIKGAQNLNTYILEKTPEHLLRTTHDFWKAWVSKYNFNFLKLDENIILLFKKSLLTIRAHTDNRGAIIASGDSDMLQGGRDTYGYMWPRDGSFSAMALDMAGDTNVVRRFFDFCNDIVADDGYFMHKYKPDKSLGSSWHPWIRGDEIQLPIQEDETALVIYALWKHYTIAKDLEFIEKVYNSLIKKSADFLVNYRDKNTGLPKPSYDLWEEKLGVSTFSSSAVYGALIAASNFAKILGKQKSEKLYKDTADEMKEAIIKYLYDEKEGTFHKMINFKDGEIIYDRTLDMSSVYGIFTFGVLEIDDDRVRRAIKNVEERLLCKTKVGGIARYEGDPFYRQGDNVPGNPWFITTLWLAQYYIEKAKKEKDFEEAKKWLNWTVDNALSSGVLSEQLNPHTGKQLSAAPLTWSHAEFVITIMKYLDKLEELGLCDKCNPVI